MEVTGGKNKLITSNDNGKTVKALENNIITTVSATFDHKNKHKVRRISSNGQETKLTMYNIPVIAEIKQ